MDFTNIPPSPTFQPPSALSQLAQILSSIQKRPQVSDAPMTVQGTSAAPEPQSNTSGASALGKMANNFIGSMVNPTQLPWQAIDPNNPGKQLPWQMANPSNYWDTNNSLGGNLVSHALTLLTGS